MVEGATPCRSTAWAGSVLPQGAGYRPVSPTQPSRARLLPSPLVLRTQRYCVVQAKANEGIQ
jgi:hypothetical protein